jgi:hypothetical protein
MFLSSRDIKWAIECGHLIVDPSPEQSGEGYDETSINLHLDHIREAQVWNLDALKAAERARAEGEPEVLIGQFNYAEFSERYLMAVPELSDIGEGERSGTKVYKRGTQVVVKPGASSSGRRKRLRGSSEKRPYKLPAVRSPP